MRGSSLLADSGADWPQKSSFRPLRLGSGSAVVESGLSLIDSDSLV